MCCWTLTGARGDSGSMIVTEEFANDWLPRTKKPPRENAAWRLGETSRTSIPAGLEDEAMRYNTVQLN